MGWRNPGISRSVEFVISYSLYLSSFLTLSLYISIFRSLTLSLTLSLPPSFPPSLPPSLPSPPSIPPSPSLSLSLSQPPIHTYTNILHRRCLHWQCPSRYYRSVFWPFVSASTWIRIRHECIEFVQLWTIWWHMIWSRTQRWLCIITNLAHNRSLHFPMILYYITLFLFQLFNIFSIAIFQNQV